MPLSGHLKDIREKVGHDLLVLPSCGVAIFDDSGRILCGLHSDRNIWVLPGGLIEPMELPSDGAVREVWEETGLIVELTRLLGVFGGEQHLVTYRNGDRTSYVTVIFTARVIGGELRVDGDEILDARYLSRAELEHLPHARWLDSAIPILFSPPVAAYFQQSTLKMDPGTRPREHGHDW
jgi:8-oxo-dGTP pyrophosphatase MutT (NUDIX family)